MRMRWVKWPSCGHRLLNPIYYKKCQSVIQDSSWAAYAIQIGGKWCCRQLLRPLTIALVDHCFKYGILPVPLQCLDIYSMVVHLESSIENKAIVIGSALIGEEQRDNIIILPRGESESFQMPLEHRKLLIFTQGFLLAKCPIVARAQTFMENGWVI